MIKQHKSNQKRVKVTIQYVNKKSYLESHIECLYFII